MCFLFVLVKFNFILCVSWIEFCLRVQFDFGEFVRKYDYWFIDEIVQRIGFE